MMDCFLPYTIVQVFLWDLGGMVIVGYGHLQP